MSEIRKDMSMIKNTCRLLMMDEGDHFINIRTIYDLSMKHSHGYENEDKTGLLGCPFCNTVPEYPSGDGTQYEIVCEQCGMAQSCVQISDIMTIEERISDDFIDYRYGEEFVERAKEYTTKMWNKRY